MFTGLHLAGWIVGLTVLYLMYRRAVRLSERNHEDA